MSEPLEMPDVIHALEQAAFFQRKADLAASYAASLVVGRLRHVDTWTLKKLKLELRDYNMHTEKWKR